MSDLLGHDPGPSLGVEDRREFTHYTDLPPVIEDLTERNSWKLTPAVMAHYLTNGWFAMPPHIRLISARVASAISRGNGRIIVSLPPRHGKSELLSVAVPMWIFEVFPWARVMGTSYGADLAKDFSRRVRDELIGNEDRLTTRIRKDARLADRFETVRGGVMYATGIGGAITGRGADLLLVDDYLKNAKDASSETIRDDIYHWFVSTAMSRLEPGGTVIILATRWHQDDLIGRLLEQAPDVWEYIRIPAIAEENDPLKRAPGEALWPERYNVEWLESQKALFGPYFWAALYRQDPISMHQALARGEIRIVDSIDPATYSRLRMCRFWDLAATEGEGDYTSGTLLGEDDELGLTYWIDQIRAQIGPADVEQLVRKTAEKDGPDVPIRMEEEPGSAGKTTISLYARKILRGYNFEGIKSTGPKFVRAQPLYAAVHNGTTCMVRAPWNKELREELEIGTEGDHDDQIDSSAGAFNFLNLTPAYSPTWGRSQDRTPLGRYEHAERHLHGGSGSGSNIITGVAWGRPRRQGRVA